MTVEQACGDASRYHQFHYFFSDNELGQWRDTFSIRVTAHREINLQVTSRGDNLRYLVENKHIKHVKVNPLKL